MTMKLVALYIFAVFSLVAAQEIRPTFDGSVTSGPEGGNITGRLVVSGLQREPVTSGFARYEIASTITGGRPATRDVDYQLNVTTVTFYPGNESSSEFVIYLFPDNSFEGEETFELNITYIEATGDFNRYRYPPAIDTLTITIIDDPNDVVTCRLNPPLNREVREGVNKTTNITSSCEGQFERCFDIGIVCQGVISSEIAMAEEGPDKDFEFPKDFKFEYCPSNGSIDVMAAEIFTVTINDDNEKDEPLEQLICDLVLGSGLVAQIRTDESARSVTIDILDNDQLFVSWRNLSYCFLESETARVQMKSNDTFPRDREFHTRPQEITEVIVNSDNLLSNFMQLGLGAPSTVDFMNITYYVAKLGLDIENDQVSFEFKNGTNLSTDEFMIIEDDICEPDEIIRVIFETQPNLNKGDPEITYLIIKDDDRAEIAFSDVSYNIVVNEDTGSVEVFVESNIFIDANTVINITCTPGNASEADFGGPYSYMLELRRSTFNPPPRAMFQIPITDDAIPESTECFVCEIISKEGLDCTAIGSQSLTQICIKDNDERVAVIIHNDTVVEGEKANILLELESPLEFDCNITVQTADRLARAPIDYVSGQHTVMILAGNTTAILMVMTNDDDIAELTENFAATIVDTCDLTIPGNPSISYVNILDNDTITCSKASRSVSVNEGITAQINVVCSGQYDFEFSLSLDTADGSAVAPRDYTPGGYSLSFSGDQRLANVTVETVADSIVECDESFQTKITGSSRPEKVNIVDPDTCDVIIEDNNDLMVMFDPVDYQVSEGETAVVMLVTNLNYTFNFSVIVACMNGSAFAPGDFIAEQYTVNFPASLDGPGKASIAVRTLTDNVLEDVEFLKCNILEVISDETCSVLRGPDDMVRVNITDNTNATVCFEPLHYQVIEGESVTLRLVTNVIVQKSFSVIVTTMDDSASSSSDYVGGTMTANFVVGNSTATVTYRTVDDSEREVTEFFTAQLSVSAAMRAMGISVGDDCTSRVEIVDNEALFVMLETKRCITAECDSLGGNATLEVALVASTTCELEYTVIVTASDVTAKEGGDYIGQSFSVTFSPSQTRVPFNITIVCDNIAELDEIFTLQLEAPQNMNGTCRDVQLGTPVRTNCTIEDEDTITCSKAPENDTVTEGGVAGLTVECSGEYEFDFTLFLDTMDGSAVAPGDYTSGGYSLSFTAGQTSGILSVQTSDDTIAECDEFFKVMITGSDKPDKVIIGDPDICYAIIQDDNDDAGLEVCINVTSVSCLENVGTCQVCVVANRLAECEYSLSLETENGTAVAPEDYISREYNVIFPRFETVQCINVSIVDDNCVEDMEAFSLELGIGEDSPFRNMQFCNETDVPIVDNDAQVNFTKEMYEVQENSSVSIGLTISGDVSSSFRVEIIVKPGGTATGSQDFTGVPRPVDIPRGAVETAINFLAICDNITEGLEYVELEIVISNVSMNRVKAISPITARVNIIDICISPPTEPPSPAASAMPVNDSVIADPLYTVPLRTMNTSNIIEGTPLCYEVHGRADRYFNLVSDDCTSVNAHLVAAVRPRAGNVIGQIGIVTSDSRNRCHQIQVDVTSDGQCQTQIDDGVISLGTTNTTITGVNVTTRRHYVRVSTPNCAEQDLVMWIRCHKPTLNQTGDSFDQPMIKFVVTRGLKTRSEAHGLIGQFWGVPVHVTRYIGGLLPSAQAHSGTYYTLHFNATSPSQRRTFTAKLGWTTWRLNFIPTLPGYRCFYAGNSQGGPSIEATDPGVQDSVIEGKYQDYMASGLFDTQWHDEFSRFKQECNP